jgi:hypothetical protein
MSDSSTEPLVNVLGGADEVRPDIDANGVDRAQVRHMLALSPVARLRWLEETMEDIAELRQLNEKHAIR